LNHDHRLLVIDTATDMLSIALFDRGVLIDHRHELLGRGHAERLVPAIAELDGGGRAAEIRVDRGPGSFTGVRIGLAAARGLALAWGASIRTFDVAALMLASSPSSGVAMEGGHGEWIVGPLAGPGRLRAFSPQQAAAVIENRAVIGPRAAELVALRGWGQAIEGLPDARNGAKLCEEDLSEVLSPQYARGPDATLPAPRNV